ncbi:hypothetical protein K1719_036564 [Acacia pycnantha]|nr:hypothetical protein K1719_036564 [Acacia pycnantha]
MPRSTHSSKGKKSGPGPHKPTNDNTPSSRVHGLNLSSGVNIHKLGSKPNSEGAGPSVRILKELARGIQDELDPTFPSIFKSFAVNYKADIFVILEPRISGTKADSVIRKLGFHNSHRVEASGFSGGIWILWSSKVDINILTNQVQFVHMNVSYASQNINFLFTAVYRSPQKQFRKYLWQDLTSLAESISNPWVLAGDFNAILNSNERQGGSTNRA